MSASWVAASAALLVTALTATPAAAGFVEVSFSETSSGDDLYRLTVGSEAPLFDLWSFELEEIVSLEGEVPSTRPLLPLRWNPIVRHATEPSSLVLMGTGLLGIATFLRRRRQTPR